MHSRRRGTGINSDGFSTMPRSHEGLRNAAGIRTFASSHTQGEALVISFAELDCTVEALANLADFVQGPRITIVLGVARMASMLPVVLTFARNRCLASLLCNERPAFSATT